VDAGSEKFYSVNPTNFEVYSEFDYIFMKSLEAGVGVAQSFYGVNSAQGFTAEFMVRFNLPGKNPPESSGDGFHENVENYKQNLFEESKPEVTPPPTQNAETPQPQDQQQKPKKKKSNSLDKMFKDTEKSLEK
jgi:hypothetical protein